MPSPYYKANIAEIPLFYQKVHYLKTFHLWSDCFSLSSYQWCKEEGLIYIFLKMPFSCPIIYDSIVDDVTPTQAL
jgi:hypothetical protein